MTVIVAAKNDDRSVIAADWSASAETVRWSMKHPKVSRLNLGSGPMAFVGIAGYPAVSALLQSFVFQTKASDKIDQHWANSLAIALTAHLAAIPGPHYADGELQGELLMIVEDKIFYLDTNWAMEVDESYAAIGSGADFARGALWAMDHEGDPTPPVIASIRAVEAACAFSPGCALFGRIPYTREIDRS